MYIFKQEAMCPGTNMQWKQRETKGWKMPVMAWTVDAAIGVIPVTPWLSHQGQLQASGHTSLFLSAMNLSFHRTATKLCLPTLASLILTLTGRGMARWGMARLGIWQLYSCLWSYFAVGTVLMHFCTRTHSFSFKCVRTVPTAKKLPYA